MPKTKPKPSAALRAPTEAEAFAIAEARASQAKRPARPSVNYASGEKGVLRISNPHTDVEGWIEHTREAFGTSSETFMKATYRDAVSAVTAGKEDRIEEASNSTLALMAAIAPQNELEAAIAVQLIAAHAASLDFLHKARVNAGAYPQTAVAYAGVANKLSRTVMTHAEGLAKLRSGGKQQVIVKHIYVDARGGQNVIGSEIAAGGGPLESRLPHRPEDLADLALAGGSEVPGEEPRREPVHVAGPEGAEPVSPARRQQPQGA